MMYEVAVDRTATPGAILPPLAALRIDMSIHKWFQWQSFKGVSGAGAAEVSVMASGPRHRRAVAISSRWPVDSHAIRSLEGMELSDAVWRALAQSHRWSRRECQIVPSLVEDQKETAIARRLGISPHTVHTHTERLYRKMGVSSRVALVRRIFVEYVRLANGTSDRLGLHGNR